MTQRNWVDDLAGGDTFRTLLHDRCRSISNWADADCRFGKGSDLTAGSQGQCLLLPNQIAVRPLLPNGKLREG